MAESPVIPRMTRPQVIQGKRHEIEARLQQLDDEETLTLIVPGKELAGNGTAGPTVQSPPAGKTFRDIFVPSQEGFDQTSLTEEELSDGIEAEVKAYRTERQAREAQG